MNKYGFVNVTSANFNLKLADCDYNRCEIEKILNSELNTDIIVFPELSLTGYTCANLFKQDLLLKKVYNALSKLTQSEFEGIFIIGTPIKFNSNLYNCAAVFNNNKLLGLIPKTNISGSSEFYEHNIFSSWNDEKVYDISLVTENGTINTKIGTNILFEDIHNELILGIEIGEDILMINPPSSKLTLSGANLICNLSAINEQINKTDFIKDVIKIQTLKTHCGYIYSNSGINESTTDLVFSGHSFIINNGKILSESNKFNNEIISAQIDINANNLLKNNDSNFSNNEKINIEKISVSIKNKKDKILNNISRTPFVPTNAKELKQRCENIVNIQANGLAKRLRHTGSKKMVLGVSGGLDSTLALLIAVKTADILKIPHKDIIGITMPGLGTSSRTLNNSLALMNKLDITQMEISIKDACIQHFKDINHDINDTNIAFENAQARERTQILMDVANDCHGMVIGTGNMSEAALGYCTYNGDHMSMYAVNSNIPKTLIKHIIRQEGINCNYDVINIIENIIETPISPELLPSNNNEFAQKTEDNVGPYELNDFFLYYVIKYNFTPEKILELAKTAFENKYTNDELRERLKLFYKRFFNSQFKRSCSPDGPKVGSISLSPRSDWKMPSDAIVNMWINSI